MPSQGRQVPYAASLQVALILSGLLALPNTSRAQQWPQFRGSEAGIAADDPALPDRWSETENVVWATTIPGHGWSSPVVWGDHVFVTTAMTTDTEPTPQVDLTAEGGWTQSTASLRWIVYDLDVDSGSVRWERMLHTGIPPIAKHDRNTYATETPVTDGERLYVFFGTIGLLAALEFDGTLVWTTETDVPKRFQPWGVGGSPALHENRLYLVNDNSEQSYITAFDTATGAEVWRTERAEIENWSTPIVWTNDQRTEIVTAGERRVRSYGLDGSLLWELGGTSVGGPIGTPFVRGGLLYVSSGHRASQRRPVFAVRPGASGDITLAPGETSSEYVAWSQPRLGSYQTSGLVYGDYLYTLLDRGFLLCHDARTGAEVYGRTRINVGSSFAASPWAYNGKIFVLSEAGDTFVIQAGSEFELLGKNSLNDYAMATPAVAAGSVFIRTQSTLYRIGKGTQR